MQLDSSLFLEGSSTLYLNVTFLRSLQGKAISGYPWCGHESVLPPEKYVKPTGPARSSLSVLPSLLHYAPSPPQAPSPVFYSFHPISPGRGPWVPTSQWWALCMWRERGREKLKSVQAAWVISF